MNEDEDGDHPLALRYNELDLSDFTGVLTPEIAREWLVTGDVPDRRSLVRVHGLQKFRILTEMMISAFRARETFIQECSFAVPCKEALDAIGAGAPLIEVGAGTGFWAALLARRGVDIRACDSPAGTHYSFSPAIYYPCTPVDAEDFVRANPDRNVLMVWPCYKKDWAMRAARAMQSGRTLFLVSEGWGGCVADDDLFKLLQDSFTEAGTIYIPVWPGIGDFMGIYVKR